MGVKAATFVRGRLLMHGAAADTAVTAVENAGRPGLPGDRDDADRPAGGARRCRAREGPVMILYGLAPRAAALMLDDLREAL